MGAGKGDTCDLFAQRPRILSAAPACPFPLPYTIPHANNELRKAVFLSNALPNERAGAGENNAAMITRMDRFFGEPLLNCQGWAGQDTIVFFSSDNGPHQEGGVTEISTARDPCAASNGSL
jgi:hypothetical protein